MQTLLECNNDTLVVQYDDRDRGTVLLTFPCGCTNRIMPAIPNANGTPTQFRWYCNEHFYE